MPPARPMPRSRHRDNAGKSAMSWKKHGLLWRIARGQAHAFRVTHPEARCVLVDMHAGDGAGVDMPQLDLFEPSVSRPSAQVAVHVARDIGGADVILCEQNRAKRTQLAARFPEATIVREHHDVLPYLMRGYDWALVFNDPCGYASHGIDTLEKIARTVRSDFLIVFNERALGRLMGMKDVPDKPDPPRVAQVRQVKHRYAWMMEPAAWARLVDKPQVARSRMIHASSGFTYRILVLSTTFCQLIKPPLWETIACKTSR